MRLSSLLATVVLGVSVGLSPVGAGPASAGKDLPPLMLGPGDAGVSDIGGKAVMRMTKHGYVYISGQHSHHLRITYVKDRNILRYRDTRTPALKSKPKTCGTENVKKGISVICTVPKKFDDQKMFVQVWPRLGNDYTDARSLGRRFRLWVLADDGADVVHGGKGNDFVNAAMGNDRAYGGGGRDWLRGGPGADTLVGGDGDDRVSQG